MLKNYILSAIRNITKKKLYSSLNILGLAIGMAGTLLILQYVRFETSYNNFHEHRDNIYRISYSKEKSGVESFNTVLTYMGVGPLMVQQFPEVVDFTRLHPANLITSKALIQKDEHLFEEEGIYFTDPSFFTIFSFELVEGDPSTALNEQFSAVISESMAKKYFGNENPIGKTIRKDRDENYIITGIIKDTPKNSHIKINLLLSHNTLSTIMGEHWDPNNLTAFHGHLYIKTVLGTNPELLAKKFPQFVMDYIGGKELAEQDVVLKFAMLPISDIHLKSHIEHEAEINGDQDIVDYMTIVGYLILIIALVNYVNLATARALERAKEIGVRKAIGANKSLLFIQYMTESFVVNFLAVTLGLFLVWSIQPFLDQLGAPKLQNTNILQEVWFWLALLIVWITSSLLSGFYPAFVLASYHPVAVLKGKLMANRKGILLRKGFVIFQFACSACLIIGTIIIFSQITYMRDQKLGMNIDDKFILKGPAVKDSTLNTKYKAFKNALLQLPGVKSVTGSNSIPGKELNSATWFSRVDNPEADSKFCYINAIQSDFAQYYELTFVAGHNFTETDQTAILLNETAVKLFDFKNLEFAIGKTLVIGNPNDPDNQKWKIAGIVKDFNQQSLKNDISPLILLKSDRATNFISMQLNRTETGFSNLGRTIDQVREHWLNYFPGNPFNYHFLRTEFDEQYKTELEFGRLLSIFSGVAILVAILGLIGLSSYTIQQRTKELGIRKALGSGTKGIVILLSKDIFQPILIANLITWPICWYVFSDWLTGFAFRTPMSIWPFMLSLAMISIVAVSALAYQITKASLSNPVKALRYE
ncbi:putative ABC transport system permease protein [Reichenbachiella faecimaris]|uniref:Putative ABC transport system permease protein n=1 Tax=Reichenbachiella faecimaris TaxID=692418 RepID=A0A1W2GE22_REIFA|nr:ABC transporter permease [Reichenbachiella faecimaris]SMD34742.1 putative ABC transport system permease protein [Reichenbachiella faecimaris]